MSFPLATVNDFRALAERAEVSGGQASPSSELSFAYSHDHVTPEMGKPPFGSIWSDLVAGRCGLRGEEFWLPFDRRPLTSFDSFFSGLILT